MVSVRQEEKISHPLLWQLVTGSEHVPAAEQKAEMLRGRFFADFERRKGGQDFIHVAYGTVLQSTRKALK